MPSTEVIFYREDDGTVPVLDWLDDLPDKARDKCLVRIERLRDLGNALRRPEADYLRNGIYELRARLHGIHYRVLYFFYGRGVAVLGHAVTKERAIPAKAIDRAIQRKEKFERNPGAHTHRE